MHMRVLRRAVTICCSRNSDSRNSDSRILVIAVSQPGLSGLRFSDSRNSHFSEPRFSDFRILGTRTFASRTLGTQILGFSDSRNSHFRNSDSRNSDSRILGFSEFAFSQLRFSENRHRWCCAAATRTGTSTRTSQNNRLNYKIQWLHVGMQPASFVNRAWKAQFWSFQRTWTTKHESFQSPSGFKIEVSNLLCSHSFKSKIK